MESGLSFWGKLGESKVFTMPAGNGKFTDSSETGVKRSVVVYAQVADIRSTGLTGHSFLCFAFQWLRWHLSLQ